MARSQSNNSAKANGLLACFAVQKKKVIVAGGLVLVMVFMWVRVLAGKSPQAAAAAVMPTDVAQAVQNTTAKTAVTFLQLPDVPGRHDTFARDFFTMDETVFGSKRQVRVVAGGDRTAARIAEKLTLGAIIDGKDPQAFINDRFVMVGDILTVEDAQQTHECEVVAIKTEVVVIRCGTAEIELGLKQSTEEVFED